VILALSPLKLQIVLDKLFAELKKFNLCINLVKTETMTFSPARVRTDQIVTLKLNNVPLKNVDLFKYLGIFVTNKWGFSGHITRMDGRSEAAAAELLRLATRLDIRQPDRITVFFRSLVKSQWHGLELLPVSVCKLIESSRAHFINRFYNLPSSTASLLSVVLLDLWPAEYDALARRVSFANRLTIHDLDFVRSAFEFDRTHLFRARVGWHYDGFLLFRSLFKREKIAEFDMQRVSSRLSVISGAKSRFLFFYYQRIRRGHPGPLQVVPICRDPPLFPLISGADLPFFRPASPFDLHIRP
jgi:hypothetical protein